MSTSQLSPARGRAGHLRDDLPTELPDNAGRAAAGIAIVLIAQLMLVLDVTVVNVALPAMDAALSFGPASLSWILNGYTLAFGGLLLTGGRLGDVFGRLRVFEIGLALFTVSSLLGGLAQTPGQLVAARAAQGVGAAMAAPGVLALLTTSAPDEAARNRALALFAAVSMGGGTIGLLLGGVVTDLGSWRWTLLINVPIGILVLALARRFVTETPRRPGRFDFVGAATATGTAVSVVWALIGVPEHGWVSLQTLGGFALGALLLVAFVLTERRVAHPMLRASLLRNRPRVGGLMVIALVVGGQMSVFFLTVQYLQRELGFGPLSAGASIVPLTVGVLFMSRVVARLLARFGHVPLLMVGTLGLAGANLWLSNVGADSNLVLAVLGPMLLNGLSAGLVFMPASALILGGVEPEHAGSASGLLQTTQQLGGAVGLAVIVSVYAAGAVPGDFLPGAQAAFLTAASFAAVAFVVIATVIRPATRKVAAAA
jgi:EmrB/QacA subfamily drug resistance transporter